MMRVKILSIIFSVLIIVSNGVFSETIAPEVFIEPRYQVTYSKSFFKLGGSIVKYRQNRHLKIGIIIRNRTDFSIKHIIETIFSVAPFDRYRDFFVFANADEATREIRQRNQFISTYDSYGRRIGGGFDWSAMRVRAGLVVLDVNDYEWKRSGSLGYAFKQTAITQKRHDIT